MLLHQFALLLLSFPSPSSNARRLMLYTRFIQGLTAGFPVDDRVQFGQRIALIEPGIAFIQVEVRAVASVCPHLKSDDILH